MHWSYGSGWGALYGILAGDLSAHLACGTGTAVAFWLFAKAWR